MPSLTLMAVHAHPDDECFGGGGTLARYSAEGYKTILVTCTNGEEGEIVDPEMNHEETRSQLAAVRLAELDAAAKILGVSHTERLGYRDSGMVDTPANNDLSSFNRADPEEVTGRLVALMRRHRPDVVFTYAEDGGYGHPDHLMAHAATVAAFEAVGDPSRYPDAGPPWSPRKLYYCAWLVRSKAQGLWRAARERGIPITFGDRDAIEPPDWGVLDEEITAHIDVRAYIDRKVAALRAHRSQIRSDSTFLNLPDDLADTYLGDEGFRLAQTRVEVSTDEESLFEGLGSPEGRTTSSVGGDEDPRTTGARSLK